MRWKANQELSDWVAWPLMVAVSPALIVGAACLFLTFGTVWLKRRAIGPSEEWSWWFAWYPVCRNVDNEYDESVWLEWIERRCSHFLSDDTEYRARYTSQVTP
jgi:hypothetical protein